MSTISPISRNDLAQRRKQLRRERRARLFQAGWRNIAVAGLAIGTIWVVTLPAWVIRKPEQVTIEGNRFISAQTIRTYLPIAYPQSLLKIQPQPIAEKLKAKAPIAEATVDRQLFPPSLTVRIRERVPIATTISKTSQPGLLDDSGVWISQESYLAVNPGFKPPALKVMGQPDQYRSQWATLYSLIQQSPVKVLEIDWNDQTNLILKTELGAVHFGAYSGNFANQLKALDKMRRLSSRLNPNEIAYIDLRNPDSPTIQMNTSKTPVKLGTP
jgi:cell division protein FtsQ